MIATITAIPPTTPPTIPPTGVFFDVDAGGGVAVGVTVIVDGETPEGDEVGLVDSADVDIVLELVGTLRVTVARAAVGLPPSVATANCVTIVGESSQNQFVKVGLPVLTSRFWLQ
jgi:hypothetical protein